VASRWTTAASPVCAVLEGGASSGSMTPALGWAFAAFLGVCWLWLYRRLTRGQRLIILLIALVIVGLALLH